MSDPNRPRDSLRPELWEAIDESWKLHEAAYRCLGRGGMDPWQAKNDRRLDLIHLKFSGGLDAEREAELEILTREIHDHMRVIDPRLVEDQIDARLGKIKQRLEKRGNE